MAITFVEDWNWMVSTSVTEMGKNGWARSQNGVNYVASGGVNNSRYVDTSEGSVNYFEHSIPNLVNTCGVVFSCLVTGTLNQLAGTSGSVIYFRRLNATHMSLTIDPDGRLVALAGGTPVAASAAPVPIGTWFDLECKIIVHDTTGYFGVRLDGQLVIQYNGNTLRASDGWVGTIRFSNPGVVFSTCRVGYDNIVFWDNTTTHHVDWLGRVGIVYLPVNGDGSQLDWTPSVGTSHYTLIDEVGTPITGDYISAGDVDLKDILDLTNPPGNVSKIEAVIPVVFGNKLGSGPSDLELGLELSGVEHYGSLVSVPGTNGFISSIFDVNPQTGAAWTAAEVSSARLLLKSK